MNVLILGNISDRQTGLYILDASKAIASNVSAIDIRRIVSDIHESKAQEVILSEVDTLKHKPDIIVVLKGLELALDTLKAIKNKFPKATIVNWFFDKFLLDKEVWNATEAFHVFREYDYFFCSLKGAADKLQEAGVKNAYYLDEGCHPIFHKAPFFNYYQEQKYAEDVTFIGSIGYELQHANRMRILNKITKEGFRMRIWGPVVCDWGRVPEKVKNCHAQTSIINEKHSIAAITSKINLGIDQDVFLELGHSARLYRVMCAGGLYLTTYVPGLEKVFKINKDGGPITGEEDLVAYYCDEGLIHKLDFLLEHDDIRKSIAKNGQKAVLAKHTFQHRMKEMLEIIKRGKKDAESKTK